MSKIKIGDKVKHVEHGTIGTVIDIDPNLGIYVDWGCTTGYYGEYSNTVRLIEKI